MHVAASPEDLQLRASGLCPYRGRFAAVASAGFAAREQRTHESGREANTKQKFKGLQHALAMHVFCVLDMFLPVQCVILCMSPQSL